METNIICYERAKDLFFLPIFKIFIDIEDEKLSSPFK